MKERLYPIFSVLLVDDEPNWMDSLSLTLERTAGITNTILCQDSRRVMEILSHREIGLVLLDLTMPHLSGQEVLRLITEQHPEIIVIVLSGMNQLETAVHCMKLGAFDYYVKTEGEDRIVTGVLHALRMIELRRENSEVAQHLLADTLRHPDAFAEIISNAKSIRSVFQYSEAIAQSTHPVLITGESGVGKELFARAIHRLSGRQGTMMCVNAAGLDDCMFADTLFGHVRGAFTGGEVHRNGMVEEAAHGTLFLDEIGDLGLSSQVKLLRLLQEGEYFPIGSDRPKRVQARIITATNQDLTAKMRSGSFRKDLYYRLQTHKIHIPPLRERKEDLSPLVNHFFEEAAREFGKKKPAAPKELVPLLESYHFPGNVRELQSMVYDAVPQHKSGILSLAFFLKAMGRDVRSSAVSQASCEQNNVFATLEILPTPEQAYEMLVEEAMRRTKGNQSQAARLLGMSQPALNKRLKRQKQADR